MSGILRALTRLLSVCVLWCCAFHSFAQASPEVTRGLQWLSNQVQVDGSLHNEAQSIATSLQSRSEAQRTLKLLASVPSPLTTVIAAEADGNTEYLARQVISLAADGRDTSTQLASLLARQNEDGGFGGDSDYASNSLDTAYALFALKATNNAALSVTTAAVNYLLLARNQDNGYGVRNNASNPFISALVSTALQMNSTAIPVIDAVNKTSQWLLSVQEPDGGWGTAMETSLVYLALLGTTSDTELQSRVTTFLLAQQGIDGSWNADPFVTALALRALVARPTPAATKGNVSGRIVDNSNGQTLPGATAAIDQMTDSRVIADQEGKFTFVGIEPGSYSITVSAPGYSPKALNLAVKAGTTADLGTLALFPAATTGILQGIVKDITTGTPLSGVAISVVGSAIADTITQADGTYKLIDLALGQVTLSASKAGYASASAIGTIEAGEVLVFSPTLKPVSTTGGIAGLVVDGATQAPLAGVIVTVGGSGMATTTAPNGRFGLSGITPGTVSISLSLADYEVRTVSAVITAGGNVEFQKIPLENATTPSTTGAIQGMVKDSSNGLPLGGVTIAVTGSANAATGTQPDGTFSLSGLVPGSVTITAGKDGYESVAATGTITAGSILGFSPSLKPTVASSGITGQVIDAITKAPLAGATIALGARIAVSNADGQFSIFNIPSGSYSVAISLAGYSTKTITVTLSDDNLSNLQKIELNKSLNKVVVLGKVTDINSNQPVAKASITVLGTPLQAIADSFGNYQIEGVPTGNATLRFSATGYTSDSVVLDFTANGEYQVDRGLKAGQGGDLSLSISTNKTNYSAYAPVLIPAQVKNNGGQPMVGTVSATILNDQGQILDSIKAVHTDENGTQQAEFEFPPGDTPITLEWNTLANVPGAYTVIVRVFKWEPGSFAAGVVELTENQASFIIDPTQSIESAVLTPLPSFSKLGASEQIGFKLDLVNRSNIPVTSELSYQLLTPGSIPIFSATETVQMDPAESSKSILLNGSQYKFNESGDYSSRIAAVNGTIPVRLEGRVISVAPGTRIDPFQVIAPTTITPDGDKRIRIDIRLQGIEQK